MTVDFCSKPARELSSCLTCLACLQSNNVAFQPCDENVRTGFATNFVDVVMFFNRHGGHVGARVVVVIVVVVVILL